MRRQRPRRGTRERERPARAIADRVGFTGEIRFDPREPDGQPRRRLDVQRAKALFGFEATVAFADGLDRTVAWQLSHLGD